MEKTHERTSPTSAVKSGNFSAEVGQLLTRSFTTRRVADFCVCNLPGKTDEWCLESALVGFPDSNKKKDKHLSKQVLIHY
jgi:hypothetical protein